MERPSTSSTSSLPKAKTRYWQWILFALLTLECRTGKNNKMTDTI